MTTIANPNGSVLDAGLSADLAAAALDLARRFYTGATLWALSPQWEPHAHHVAVEFVHPVVMGKRALPSVALVDRDPVAQARVAASPGDLLLAVASADDAAICDVMRRCSAWGVRTVWIGAGRRPPAGAADHVLWIDSDDPMVPATGRFVLVYHLLWELTHVCFEHPELLQPDADAAITHAAVGLLDDLAASARATAAESARLQQESLHLYAAQLAVAGAAMADRFRQGGRLYTFGNGGSSTAAATLASLFSRPAWGRAVAAWSLAADEAVVTALGNDVGFDVIFKRQIIAHARRRDVAIALSTSGNSDDLLAAITEAHQRGLLTIGFAGHDGGRMAVSDDLDYCLTVHSQSIHRIQESHAMLGYRLWSVAQDQLARRPSSVEVRRGPARPAGHDSVSARR